MNDARPSVWDAVHGNQRAVSRLAAAAVAPVHAYLFVGPPGSTKDVAARAFAALMIGGVDDVDGRDARLALSGEHPDVREVYRVGASIAAPQVTEIIRNASMAPVESDRQVMILHEFHLLDASGAARLLKTLEEPPAATVFVVLADHVSTDLVTIASRCVRIDFASVPEAEIVAVLTAEGIDSEAAASAASAAGGDIDRARLLAADPALAQRRAAFAAVPRRLDGTGSVAVKVCAELFALIEEAAAPLAARHSAELAELDERTKATGERGSGRKQLDERHKREQRRHRTDELRAGLAVTAGTYRDALVEMSSTSRPESLVGAVQRIHQTIEALDRNPNETLQIQALLLGLPGL